MPDREMASNGLPGEEFRLGEAIVRPAAATIEIGGHARRVDRMAMRVLLHLASRAGEPVSRTELLDSVWSRRHVGEEVLTVAVSTLRRALGDDARAPRFIETLAGHGYRAIAPVQPGPAPRDRVGLANGRRRLTAALGVALAGIAVAALVAAPWRSESEAGGAAAPADPEAREFWIRGRALLELGRADDLAAATRELALAAERMPEFSPVRAALGEAWLRQVEQGLAAPSRGLEAAAAAAEEVLALETDSPAARAILGTVALYRRDFPRARRRLEEALELEPENLLARSSYARYLAAVGSFEPALEQLDRLAELDPRSYWSPQAAKVLNMAGRPDLALAEIERQLELAPGSYALHVEKARSHFLMGETPRAVEELLASLEVCAPPEWTEALRSAWRTGGAELFFTRNLEVLAAMEAAGSPVAATTRAQAAALAGDLDHAFGWLEKALDRGEPELVDLARDPLLAPIRLDARYWDLLRRVGIPS